MLAVISQDQEIFADGPKLSAQQCALTFLSLPLLHNNTDFFSKKRFKKTKIRKRGASWENLEKWVPPAR
jgi:hypothetical protein